MRFDSFDFLLFALAFYLPYYLLERRAQNVLLLVASYFFYAYWDWRFLGLLIASTVVDYNCAQWIEDARSERSRKRILVLSLSVSLSVLGFFKYFNFFLGSLDALLVSLGWPQLGRGLDVVLPIGVSFYTFQTMGYVVDVYRRETRAARSFLDFAAFIAFFPQLVAGPIERAGHILPQVASARRPTLAGIREGLWLILFGYYAKLVVADNLAPWVARAFHTPEQAAPLAVTVGVYSFALQIYGDFLGYSSIARGLALLMGIRLMHNFRMPYFAAEPSDFWRRWHISLSTWLRDFLYISLGGNRRGPRRTYLNLGLTMLLGGLWHGAAWHYVAWGGYHGALLALHRALRPDGAPRPAPGRALRALKVAGFFHLTCLGWVLFRVESLGDTPAVLRRFFAGFAALPSARPEQYQAWLAALALCMPLLLVDLARERSGEMDVFARWSRPAQWAMGLVMLALIVVSGVADGGEFIYFQF